MPRSQKRAHDDETSESCVKQSGRKYRTRSSPPFPANECCDLLKHGQHEDSKAWYVSTRNSNDVCTWKPLNQRLARKLGKSFFSKRGKEWLWNKLRPGT